MKKALTALASFLGLLIVEGLSGGIAERVMMPAFDYLSNQIIRLFSFFQSPFSDNIVRLAAERHSQPFEISLIAFSCLILLAVLMLVYYQFKDRHSYQTHYRHYTVPWIFRMMMPHRQVVAIMALISVLTVSALFTRSAVKQVSDYLYKGIEIVRPKMSNHQYLELRSQIMQIKNKAEFESVSDKLQALSDENHQLPEKPNI